MAGESDIAVNISCDLDEFTAPLDGAMQQMEQMTTVVHVQQESWSSMAVTAVSAMASIAGPAISLFASYKKIQAATLSMAAANATATLPTLTLGAAVNFLLSPIVLTLGAITLLAGAVYYFSGAADDAAESTEKVGGAAKDTKDELSSLGEIQENFMAGLVGAEGLLAIEDLKDAWSDLTTAGEGLGDALLQPLRDAGFELGDVINLFTGLTSKIDMATGLLNGMATVTETVTAKFKEGVAQATLLATMAATGMNAEDAGAMIAVREAERAELVESYQAMQAALFAEKELDDLMESAAEETQKRAELTRIASITSMEALDAETESLEAQIAALKEKGKYNKDAQKDAEATAKAIANQRAAIASGSVKPKESAIDAMIRKAQEDVAALQFGANDARLMAMELGGEDPAKILALREELDVLEKLKQTEKDREKAKSLKTQADNQISSMTDKIDLLTGAASKADIAMREALRAGHSKEKAEEIRDLAAELEALEEKDKKKNNKSKGGGNAAFAALGSKEAYSTVIKAMGAGGKDGTERNTKKTADELEKLRKTAERNSRGGEQQKTAWKMS